MVKVLFIVVLLLPSLLLAKSKGIQRAEEGERFGQEDRVAVIVGINQYSQYSGLSSLNYAVPDADALAKFFKSQGYLVHLLKNADAQKHYILGAIRRAGEQLEERGQGTLVFAFSGHGFGSGDSNYLAVSGTDADNISDTGLSLKEVRSAIKKTGARRRVLFIDACRNDPNSNAKGSARAFINDDSEGENILYSTRAGKLSYEDASLGHGAFTHYVLKGLEGDAAEQGVVTFTKLSRYVSRQVKTWVHNNHNAVQVPYRSGENTGVFVLAKAPDRIVPKPVPVPIKEKLARLTVNVEPEDARVRIMNIVHKYRAGMALAMGKSYDVFITREGYKAYRASLQLSEEDQVVGVVMEILSTPEQGPLKKRQSFEPEMIVVPSGSFRMGDLKGEGNDDEKPVHRVSVPAFMLARYEVSVGQFKAFVVSSGYSTNAESNFGNKMGCNVRKEGTWNWQEGSDWRKPGFKQSDQHPVVCVSRNDAKAYIKWLNKQTKTTYRLPSESEWEYAARAGSSDKFSFGNSGDELCNYGNVADNTKSQKGSLWNTKADCSDGFWFTSPVGFYKENAYGLNDLHGNVWEWMEDRYHGSYQGAPNDGSAWMTGGSVSSGVLRSGAWNNGPKRVRTAIRVRYLSGYRDSSTGFRVAKER